MPQSRLSPQLQRQLSMRSTRQRRSCVNSAYAALAAPATAAMSLFAAGMQWEDTGSAYTLERPCGRMHQFQKEPRRDSLRVTGMLVKYN